VPDAPPTAPGRVDRLERVLGGADVGMESDTADAAPGDDRERPVACDPCGAREHAVRQGGPGPVLPSAVVVPVDPHGVTAQRVTSGQSVSVSVALALR